jgi:hypothetical protein
MLWKRNVFAEQAVNDHAIDAHTLVIDIAPVPTFVEFDDFGDEADEGLAPRGEYQSDSSESSVVLSAESLSGEDSDLYASSEDVGQELGSSRSATSFAPQDGEPARSKSGSGSSRASGSAGYETSCESTAADCSRGADAKSGSDVDTGSLRSGEIERGPVVPIRTGSSDEESRSGDTE